jgi:hypothetical protein
MQSIYLCSAIANDINQHYRLSRGQHSSKNCESGCNHGANICQKTAHLVAITGLISIKEYCKLRIAYLPHQEFVDGDINNSKGKTLIKSPPLS